MTTEKLMDALGMLPNDLIAGTDTLRSHPRKLALQLRPWAAMAACLVVVLAAGLFCLRLGLLSGMGGASDAKAELQMEMAPAAMNSLTDEAPAEEVAPRAEAEEEAPVPDTHPLPLTVSWRDGSITAQSANYTLRETLPDGSESETIACGAHPIQANPEPTAVSQETVALDWSIVPDQITVRCWAEDADITEEGYAFSILGVRNRMPVFAQYQIYEITARWGEDCTASYAVHLILDSAE